MRWLREPLVHFGVLGGALFLAFHWWGGGPDSTRIVITPGQIDAMAAGFTRTWQRPPTDEELKGLVDDYVREEMATREAAAMGLDRDDTIIRRRLRQKFEFVVEDAVDAEPPSEADLQAWLDRHPEMFRIEPRVWFRHVFVSEDRRGAAAEDDARRLLARLTAAGAAAAIDTLGDPLMLPRRFDAAACSDIARQFGDGFAEAILEVETGRWTGPIRSGYGLHLVFVGEVQPERAPALDDVRPAVEREYMADRRHRELDAVYERLLERYRVTMAPREGAK